MLGFWFAVLGLIFGVICSYSAKKKNRSQKEWFTIGFIFSVVGYFMITLLPKISDDSQKIVLDDDPEEMTISFRT